MFGGGVENIAQACHGNAHLLKILPQLRQPDYRRGHLPGQHIEGNQLADGQLAVDHQPRAQPQGGHGNQLLNQLHALLADGGQAGNAEAGTDIGGQLLIPAACHLRLHSHGFYRAHGGDGFH